MGWKSYRELCDREEFEPSKDLYCINQILFPKFVNRKIEILSWQPALVKYHGFFDENKVNYFLNLINSKTQVAQEVVNDDGDSLHPARQVNGSFIYLTDIPDMVDHIEGYLPEIDFKASEPITSLSYLPGGHYAPHHDHLERYSGEDWWMDNMRNRMATLIFVFKKAESGGGTVFPSIDVTVRAEPGDAFLWFNMKGDESLEELSLHGGCPVYSGEKIIGTIWIRAVNQPILSKILDGQKTLSADLII
ncbi:unnamed protein product [Caenorhabditis angaria]|uniref:Fe2OG dioxygenase domain-containing protein n=1 Tax=Caenorhabditis angaria TaxID=860376 RepID=A0A9P1IUQ3_9PELO|nr:unnamed protein product [Caenorhabditis angaria]